MNWQELKRFCAKESEERVQLQKPFVYGDHAYATNGHVAVRVPLSSIEIPADHENDPWWDLKPDVRAQIIIGEIEKHPAKWQRVKSIPNKKPEKECEDCGGSGIAECPTCGHEEDCGECDGTGKYQPETFCIMGDVCFCLTHLSKIKGLPGLFMGLFPQENLKAQRFKFDGGEGCIMTTKRYEGEQIELIDAQ